MGQPIGNGRKKRYFGHTMALPTHDYRLRTHEEGTKNATPRTTIQYMLSTTYNYLLRTYVEYNSSQVPGKEVVP